MDSYRLPPPFDAVPVEFGPLRVDLASLTQVIDATWVDDRTVAFVGDLVSVAVHGTSLVEVEVAPGVHDEVVEAMLYGYVMRALFRHSGIFSLHASLLQFGETTTGRAVAIAGHSGAGKSTTVSYTAGTHQARVVVDDVLPVVVRDGVAMAHPFTRPVHLVPDAAVRLGLDAAGVPDDPAVGIGKVVADLASPAGPVAIDHLVVLSVGEPDATDALAVRPIRGAERLRHVVRNSNVTGIASFAERADDYLRWATELASCVAMTEVIRRPGADTIDDVARLIASGLEPAV